MKDIFAYTQYCDDVRQEMDGRPSLMGIFPSQAVVEVDGNNKLSRLCAYTVISLPASLDLESIAVISTWEKSEAQRVEIPAEAIDEFNLKRKEAGGEKIKLNLATVIEIRDLDIGNGGRLRTQAVVNGNVIDTRTLYLKPASSEAD